MPGEDTARAVRERQRLEARAEAEEGMMARVPLTKQERAGLKQQRRAGLAGNSFIDDFADDVDAIVQVNFLVLALHPWTISSCSTLARASPVLS